MTKYKYTAIKESGEKYEGEKEAPNKFNLYSDVRKEGGTIISVEEVQLKKFGTIKLPAFLGRVKTIDKIQFAKNLGVMVEAGLPLTRALSVMERQTRRQGFKEVLASLGAAIGKGESLSSAMSKHPKTFSPLFISMTKAGEESGSLTKSLKAIGGQIEKAYLLTKKVRGAMIYPAIVITVMLGIAVLMLIFVVPTLTATFKDLNLELPLTTKIVIFVSEFLRNNTFISLGLVIVTVAALVYWHRTPKGKRFFDMLLLRLPIVGGLVKETNSARTARTLSSLLSAGVDFLIAIKITKDVVQNGFYKEVLKKAEEAVEKGKPISDIFLAEEKLYPVFVGEMASIGEETGRLSEMFENVAEFYENEVEQKTKDMSTIIEPILMVVIGASVGLFAVSMLTPIYSLVDAI